MKKLFFFFLFALSYAFTHPKVTIITSVYKGDAYIEHFLKEISKQTLYSECHHLIINANSPGNERKYIQEHLAKFPNVEYLELNHDPGLYAVWNIGILKAKADYIMTANLDDQLEYTAIEELYSYIQHHPEVDLVYGDIYFTSEKNTTFATCNHKTLYQRLEFSYENLLRDCSPGPHPLWKKSLHLKCGLFDQFFKILGDWEMWLRAAEHGGVFKRYPKPLSLFYEGPATLSHDVLKQQTRKYEAKYLIKKHRIKL